MITTFDKALVMPAIGAIIAILAMFGVKINIPIEQLVALVTVLGGIIVYYVPNKKA